MNAPLQRPITLTIAALGGQGGGVLTQWLTEIAQRQSFWVQATSVPGVAQRTGATIYYLEFFPRPADVSDARRPVMALMPSPGDVDIVLASEWLEVGRMIQRGLITPDRTLLIASTHRALTISEKSHPGDGRANNIKILESAREHARQILAFDMAAVAAAHEAVISAVMLGSLAGSGGLPFSQESYRQVIEAGGIATARNLAAFTAGVNAARAAAHQPIAAMQPKPVTEPLPALPPVLAMRISTELPSPARAMASHGVARLLDYQDLELAQEYLDKLQPFAALDSELAHGNALLTTAVARGLALWLSVEDTIRVADLKTRAARQQRLQSESRANDGQIIASAEFLRPRAEEICGTLPVALGRRLRRSKGFERLVNRFSDGWQIRTSTITGFISLRILAGLRRFRRGTLRFCEEQARIRSWLTQLQDLAPKNYSLALELAESQNLVRGYGDTYEQGWQRFQELSAMAHSTAPDPHAAQRLREAREALTY